MGLVFYCKGKKVNSQTSLIPNMTDFSLYSLHSIHISLCFMPVLNVHLIGHEKCCPIFSCCAFSLHITHCKAKDDNCCSWLIQHLYFSVVGGDQMQVWLCFCAHKCVHSLCSLCVCVSKRVCVCVGIAHWMSFHFLKSDKSVFFFLSLIGFSQQSFWQ